MQHKSAPFEFKAKGSKGKFEGYASVFNNVDYGKDVIVPGAFKVIKTNQNDRVKLALFHDLERLAGTVKVEEDTKGLHVEGQMSLGVGYVRDAYELMKDGALDEMSIGYDINKGGIDYKEVEGEQVAYLTDLTLWECSLVPFGMNPEAQVGDVKSVTDFEKWIRKELGISRKQAQAVVANAKKSLLSDSANDGHLSDSDFGEVISLIEKSY